MRRKRKLSLKRFLDIAYGMFGLIISFVAGAFVGFNALLFATSIHSGIFFTAGFFSGGVYIGALVYYLWRARNG